MNAPDAEQALKSHAKANLATGTLNGRVFFSMPEGNPAFPLLTIEQVGGIYDDSSPIDTPRLSLSCWATKKEAASLLKRALLDYLSGLHGVLLDSSTVCGGATNISVLYLRDPDGLFCRYVVDFDLAVKAKGNFLPPYPPV